MRFERGKEPKEAMGVGIKSTLPELRKMYVELVADLEEFRNMHLPDYETAIEELWQSRPQRFVSKYGWKNMMGLFEHLTVEEYGVIYLLIKKHYEIIVKNEI